MQRHRGQDVAMLAEYKRVYEAAKASRAERWTGEQQTRLEPSRRRLAEPAQKQDLNTVEIATKAA